MLVFLFLMQACIGIANTIVSLVFPILINAIQGSTFFLFAAINIGTLIFYIRSIPETKNRTLEKLEEELTLLFTGQIPLTKQ